MNKICYIISAGECAGIVFKKEKEDYIIAVDGGYQYAKNNGIMPDMVLGDFDSLGFVPDEENVIVHKPEKDDTDTMLAVLEGIKLGYREFKLYGALGGRLDHTLANLQVLMYLSKRGLKGSIISDDVTVLAVTNDMLTLPAKEKGIFSVFTLDEKAKGVTIRYAKYEISEAVLSNDRALGISNEFVGKDVEISVINGTLLIFVSK